MRKAGNLGMRAVFISILFSCILACAVAAEATPDTTEQRAPTAITAAPSGMLELKEVKSSMTIPVKTSQSRVFKTKKKIVRVAVSDPSIAEAVVVSEHEFVLLGKNPGNVSVQLWVQ